MKTTLGLACALSLLTAVPTAQAQSGDFLAALWRRGQAMLKATRLIWPMR